MKWQPIETAPKDRNIWLLSEGDAIWIGRFQPDLFEKNKGHWRANAFERGDYFVSTSFSIVPTHWMPLPEPPNE